MNLYVGTSGYSYGAWKGKFYPKEAMDKKRWTGIGKRWTGIARQAMDMHRDAIDSRGGCQSVRRISRGANGAALHARTD
jgi:hypothetical protein